VSVGNTKAPARPVVPPPEAPAPPPPVVSPITGPFAEPIGMFPPACPPVFHCPPGYPYAGIPCYPGTGYGWMPGADPWWGAPGWTGRRGMYGGMPCYGMPWSIAPVVCPRCGYVMRGEPMPWGGPPAGLPGTTAPSAGSEDN
jgi:hypothetical protein